jgi:hypothetical protein
VLVYESTEQLLAEPAARRYLHTILLTALRDNATRVEVRFGEDSGMLYYRVEGRDWELTPPPDDVYPLLKQAVREVSRLVQPERPEVTVMAAVPGARYEALEIGWLTYQLGSYWMDVAVRIDPREPFGFIQFDMDTPEEFADTAGEVLSGLAEHYADAPAEEES